MVQPAQVFLAVGVGLTRDAFVAQATVPGTVAHREASRRQLEPGDAFDRHWSLDVAIPAMRILTSLFEMGCGVDFDCSLESLASAARFHDVVVVCSHSSTFGIQFGTSWVSAKAIVDSIPVCRPMTLDLSICGSARTILPTLTQTRHDVRIIGVQDVGSIVPHLSLVRATCRTLLDFDRDYYVALSEVAAEVLLRCALLYGPGEPA